MSLDSNDAASEYRAERDARQRGRAWHFLPPRPEDDPPPPISADEYGSRGRLPTEKEWERDHGGDFWHPDRLAREEGREALPTINVVSAASFAGQEPPSRPWLVPDLIPDRAVTILGGDGGVGKSLLALQLGAATAGGTSWAGTMPDPGPVLYLSAEDDVDELHRRLVDIAGVEGLASLGDLHIIPLAGLDAVLGAPDRGGIIQPTPLWQAMKAKIAELRPRLVIVDNLADAFAGNENVRPEARQFVGLLRGAAIEHSLAIVLISHPSLAGLSTGTGTSGSTAWSNSVRSRLYLDRATDEDGAEPDPKLRVLKLMKTNYAEPGTEIRLRWEAGRFRPDGLGVSGFDRMASAQRAEHVFIELLTKLSAQSRDVSHKRSAIFAPIVFSKEPESVGLSKGMLEAAMSRLFSAGKIEVEEVGPASRRHSRIIVSEASE